MTFESGLAIYFVVWWVCLFAVLPFGVRNAHEAGELVEQGNEHGAPIQPMLWRKVIATTIVSGVVFGLIWGQLTYGWITFDDIPYLKGMPAG